MSYLEPEDDCPYQSQAQTWIAIHNVMRAHVL